MSFNAIVFNTKMRVRAGVLNEYKSAVNNLTLSSDELSALNWNRRREVLAHAFRTVPYYRETMAANGIRIEDIIDDRSWSTVPVLTKNDVRIRFSDLISSTAVPRKMIPISTGGSTGMPLRVLHDQSYPIEVLGWRMLNWWDVGPADDAAFCWRELRKSPVRKALRYIKWWPTKRILIDATHISESSIQSFIARFNKVRPKYFHGYSGAIHHIAQYVIENNMHVHSPKVIWGTSSPLSEVQREVIETAFSAPVCDQYGCSEVYWLAAQCKERKGLHIFSDARHVEILDIDNKPVPVGETGAITITDLVNYGFPLIRYQNGDRGRLLRTPCCCGSPLPSLAPVQGRITDLIRLPSGSVISGDYATTLFDEYPTAVRAFQVHQLSDYSIKLRIVPGNEHAVTTNALKAVVNALKEKTCGEVPIDIETISSIDSDRGKFRYILSDVK